MLAVMIGAGQNQTTWICDLTSYTYSKTDEAQS